MFSPRFAAALAALVFLPALAEAQIGDRSDRPGEVQRSLVPANQIPAAPALTPEQAMASFKLAPGFKLELAACEPLVQEPVAAVFGPDGRLWVVEMRGYMPDLDGTGEDLPVGRVVVLRDTDGDGRFDESKVFVDRLVLPRAIELVGDGVLVGSPPELVWWRDTDGDGKADTKVVVATDYGVRVDPKRPHLANPERAPNSLLHAFDNWIYSGAYTKKFQLVNGEWQTASTIFRGQWGLSQDDYGRLYHNSNSDYLRVDVVFSDYLQRNANYPRLAGTNVNAAENQFVWPGRVNPGINRGYRPEMLREGRLKEFTAACAPWVYRGGLLPGCDGDVFVAEPAGNFVRRAKLTAQNGTVRGRNAYEQQEFLTSTDERFRPVNFTTGPDGALYIVDLYRGVLQHRISLTSYLRKQSEERRLAEGQHLGRIYRVVPADRPAARVASIPALKPEQWVGKLDDTNAWWRETAQRLLVEKRDLSLVPAIRRVAQASSQPIGRVQALWTLEGMGALDRATAVAALDDAAPVVRAHALRLSERFLDGDERAALIERMLVLARDAAPEVQLQAVLSLGQAKDARVDLALAETARGQAQNTFLRDAFFSGVAQRELSVLERLLTESTWTAGGEADKIIAGLARGVMGSRDAVAVERLATLAAETMRAGRSGWVAVLDGMVPATGASRRPIQLAKEPAAWATLAASATAKVRLAKLTDLVIWPGKPGVSPTVVAKPLDAAQQARFEQGKALFTTVCAACHQANGRGLDGLAPPLVDSDWVLGSPERNVRIVLHGVRGPILVAGRVHSGDMPAFGGALDDAQIASVLTYLRREWGHAATPVEPAQVASIRTATFGHSDAFSPEELNLLK